MNELNDDMKKMLAKQLPVQATSSPSGVPDIGPKRSLRLYDDRTLIYNENTGGQTLQNIREGSKMAVVVIDREALDGYRFVGTPELFPRASRLTTRWHLQKKWNEAAEIRGAHSYRQYLYPALRPQCRDPALKAGRYAARNFTFMVRPSGQSIA